MTNLTLRVPTKLKRALASAGRKHKRSQSDIAREALSNFLQPRRTPGQSRPKVVHRPMGYFTFDDELTVLANRSAPSFVPPNED